MRLFKKKYDVFISYAIEDKQDVAEQIVTGLRQKGITTYFAGSQLKIGDKIGEVIYDGLKKSEYVVLILSPDYVRDWPVVERHSFFEREIEGKEDLIFPVWHKISHEDVRQNYPELADRYALPTTLGPAVITENIVEQILERKRDKLKRKTRVVLPFLLIAAFTIVLSFMLYRKFRYAHTLPSNATIEAEVLRRIEDFQKAIELDLKAKNAKLTTPRYIWETYDMYSRFGKMPEKKYSFTNGIIQMNERGKIITEGIKISDGPYNNYSIHTPEAWLLEDQEEFGHDTVFRFSFAFKNLARPTFTIDSVFFTGKKAHAYISYNENLRMVSGTYSYRSGRDGIRQFELNFKGLRPKEEYVFEIVNQVWTTAQVK